MFALRTEWTKSGARRKMFAQFCLKARILCKMAEGNNAFCYNKFTTSIEQSQHNEIRFQEPPSESERIFGSCLFHSTNLISVFANNRRVNAYLEQNHLNFPVSSKNSNNADRFLNPRAVIFRIHIHFCSNHTTNEYLIIALTN